jgi:hypothetical protein
LIDVFSRKEVLAATKTSSNKLQYLERKGLISPLGKAIATSKKATTQIS